MAWLSRDIVDLQGVGEKVVRGRKGSFGKGKRITSSELGKYFRLMSKILYSNNLYDEQIHASILRRVLLIVTVLHSHTYINIHTYTYTKLIVNSSFSSSSSSSQHYVNRPSAVCCCYLLLPCNTLFFFQNASPGVRRDFLPFFSSLCRPSACLGDIPLPHFCVPVMKFFCCYQPWCPGTDGCLTPPFCIPGRTTMKSILGEGEEGGGEGLT